MSSAVDAHEVQLAIYDLSQGMALQLSAQFLGPQYSIEAIPHTGIVVYGQEFFFGQGIQSESPQMFRRNTGMQPFHIITLGRTFVTESQFRRWCVTVANDGRYSSSSYDLLTRNCNNFSDDAALEGLGLTQGVPEWILQVPGRFLASPMGQMLRPMLENMQLTSVGGATPLVPTTGTSSLSNKTQPLSSTSVETNPWAGIPSKTTEQEKKNDLNLELFSSFTKPRLARHLVSAKVSVEKIKQVLKEDKGRKILDDLLEAVTNNRKIEAQRANQLDSLLLSTLNGSRSTYALMLLRELVLENQESFRGCLEWVEAAVKDKDCRLDTTGKAVAWGILGNAYKSSWQGIEGLIDAANIDCSIDTQPDLSIRRASSSFLFNSTLIQKDAAADDMNDMTMSILLSIAESIVDETDEMTFRQRLGTVAVITRDSVTAKSLLKDLGFADLLADLLSDTTSSDSDHLTVFNRQLASEVRTFLEQ